MIETLIASLLTVFTAGVLPWLPFFSRQEKSLWPRLGIVLTSLMLSIVALAVLFSKEPLSASLSWQIPDAAFGIAIDFFGAMVLLAMSIAAFVCAIYGDPEQKASKTTWFWFNALFAIFILIVISRNGFLFILGWELTTLIVFLLLASFEESTEPIGRSGFYLIINYIGGLCLILLFAILGQNANLLEFTKLNSTQGLLHRLCIFLAIFAFFLKGGLFPFHAWVHACLSKAPVFIGAFLTGCIGNLAFYSLFRILSLAGPLEPHFAMFLAVIGAMTAIAMPLLALTRLDDNSMAAEIALSETGLSFLMLGGFFLLQSRGVQLYPFLPFLFFFSSFSILRQTGFFMVVKDFPRGQGLSPVIILSYLFPGAILWSIFGFFEFIFSYQHQAIALAALMFSALLFNRSFLIFAFGRLLLPLETKKPLPFLTVIALIFTFFGIVFPWLERWLFSLFSVSFPFPHRLGVFVSFSTLAMLVFAFFLEKAPKPRQKNQPIATDLVPGFIFAYFVPFLKKDRLGKSKGSSVWLGGLSAVSRFIMQPLIFIEGAAIPVLLLYYGAFTLVFLLWLTIW